ncbi:MAG: MBL fold metallo-hydrolase [Bacteroidia bacterium]|nr:MBL fold metallo-hydrolase [Bacteroidia bacterium]
MKLYSIETGKFRLDGGAMFGVVPKVIWNKTNPADEKNRIDMAMRCLLIEDESRLILVDNGIGHKYNDKFRDLYALNHENTLEKSLEALGFNREDITDIFLTHLHFDHCGGSTEWNSVKERYELVFNNAIHWVQKKHVEWALKPNPREKASFFKENILPIVESGNLRMLEGDTELFPEIDIKVFNGHTESQQLPLIQYKGRKILFAADLFPSYGHIPLPYVMGYDTRPLLTLEEREEWLPRIVSENIVLFYEHDPYNECGTVVMNEKGGYQSGEVFRLSDL